MGVSKAIWHGVLWLLHMMFAGPPTVPLIVGAIITAISVYFRYRFKRTFIIPSSKTSPNNVAYATNYWQRVRRNGAEELAQLFSVLGVLMFLTGLFRSF
jgi:hypothetical protein